MAHLLGAVILGLYEVVYKMALPEGHGGISSESAAPSADYAALPMHADAFDPTMTPPESRASSPPIDDRPRGPYTKPRGPEDIPLSPHKPVHDRLPSSTLLLRVRTPPSPPLSDTSLRNDLSSPEKTDYPPLPVALHANFLTSCIGIATLIMLWVPIVILDLLGWEAFRIPSFSICRGLAVVSWAGALYVGSAFPA